MNRKKFANCLPLAFVLAEFCFIINAASVDSRSSYVRLFEHRSAVCLINQLAQHNKITAQFELEETPNTNQTHYMYQLELGEEKYHASSTTKSKTKEKVSREAYTKTRYEKPKLKERTCINNERAPKSNVSLIYEYAIEKNKTVTVDVSHINLWPNTFQADIELDNYKASAIGSNKSEAKESAAIMLVNKIGRAEILRSLEVKYNSARYMVMEPVERLRLLLWSRGENPLSFVMLQEISHGDRTSTYVMKVDVPYLDAVGSGATTAIAQNAAANNALRLLNFNIN